MADNLRGVVGGPEQWGDDIPYRKGDSHINGGQCQCHDVGDVACCPRLPYLSLSQMEAHQRLAAVTDLEGEPIRPARVEVLRETPGTAVLAVTIHEGKNRQVRRMCAQCGLTVKRLRRVREGALELGDLPPGKWRYLTQDEAGALGVTP